ncbi:hypothetical protein V2J09_008757 [Rumex salicifolius]
MAAIMRATLTASSSLHTSNLDTHSPSFPDSLRPFPISKLSFHESQIVERGYNSNAKKRRDLVGAAKALPDWPLMAVLVQHMEGQRDLVTQKSIWHLSDESIKNVYLMYAMFTCWGCCFFGSTKDPYYDSEEYRGDGGDGTGHWIYNKQEDIEESSRQDLLREELIEEIELKVGGLRELGEAAERKEELVK